MKGVGIVILLVKVFVKLPSKILWGGGKDPLSPFLKFPDDHGLTLYF